MDISVCMCVCVCVCLFVKCTHLSTKYVSDIENKRVIIKKIINHCEHSQGTETIAITQMVK